MVEQDLSCFTILINIVGGRNRFFYPAYLFVGYAAHLLVLFLISEFLTSLTFIVGVSPRQVRYNLRLQSGLIPIYPQAAKRQPGR